MRGTQRRLGRVEVSHLDKVLFPDDGITKGDLLDYYRQVAPALLRHVRQRALSLRRFPDGIDAGGFVQQARGDHFPAWIPSVRTPRATDDGAVDHVVCNGAATLTYLVGQGTISLHAWQSRRSDLQRPDRLVFDLDPSTDDFAAVRRAARQVASLMTRLGLRPFAMTTGSRGVHVVAPIRRELGFDDVRAVASTMAQALAEADPDALTTEQRRRARRRRIYLDVSRNAWGQTCVAPYAVRALPGAPVATPLQLEELDDAALGPQSWHLGNLEHRLGQIDDPWRDMARAARSIVRARERLEPLGTPEGS